jgi:VWFA-related protein
MATRQLGRGLLASLLAIAALFSPAATLRAQEQALPVFRSSVAVVPIAAVVRDASNRVVRDLAREDFVVLERGTPRRIVDFSAQDGDAVSIAFLFDTSGSMGLVSNLAKGRAVIAELLARMQSPRDEAALYTFHRALREEVPFTRDRYRIQRALDRVRPWGETSLYDAIAETAKQLGDRPIARRAVVVISDGVDTSSALSASEVASLAMAIDVPVYVVAVVSPLDDPMHPSSLQRGKTSGGLFDVAHLTGGDAFHVSAFDPAAAMDRLLAAMRHQYFLAIESSSAPGWYPLEVRTKRKGLTVRARRAYLSD